MDRVKGAGAGSEAGTGDGARVGDEEGQVGDVAGWKRKRCEATWQDQTNDCT